MPEPSKTSCERFAKFASSSKRNWILYINSTQIVLFTISDTHEQFSLNIQNDLKPCYIKFVQAVKILNYPKKFYSSDDLSWIDPDTY